MSRFRSQIRVQSEQYQQHRKDMLLLIDQLLELNARGAAISARREAVFRKRNQLMPRERLARLLDPAMPWLAIGNLAGYLLDSDDEATSIPGGTCITGIGFIGGVRCVVVVDDSGIMAGSLTKAGGYRVMRAQQVSLEQKLPFVHLVESAGGDLVNYRVEGFTEGGRLFGNQALLSKAGIPVISVLHGSATAGGAYMPGLSDYVVAVKGRGRAFLAGPPLLKAATGEIASEAELGGATMHAEQSGLVDYLVDDDSQAMLLTREIISRLDWNGSPQTVRQADAAPPHYDPEEIAGIIPIDYRQPYDMRELVARIVDGSDITEFKPRFGVATVCLHAQLFGETCGILGNNGPIDPDGAVKAAQFLQLCDQSGTPVIFLQNTTGFMVGRQSEQAGMIKHGSKMIQAVRNISVPRITLMTGASFGAGNYGMCGRGFDPDFCYTYPNARTNVMGGEQAGRTMSMVAREKAITKGIDIDEPALVKREAMLAATFDNQSSAFYTSGHLMDDGMIDPRHSREALGFMLQTVSEARARTTRPNSFGVARL